MSISLMLSLAAIFGSLYWLALIVYRVGLSLKALEQNSLPLKANIARLSEPVEFEFSPAVNHTQDDLQQVLAKREQLKRAKHEMAQARRRRLIERLDDIDLDKR